MSRLILGIIGEFMPRHFLTAESRRGFSRVSVSAMMLVIRGEPLTPLPWTPCLVLSTRYKTILLGGKLLSIQTIRDSSLLVRIAAWREVWIRAPRGPSSIRHLAIDPPSR